MDTNYDRKTGRITRGSNTQTKTDRTGTEQDRDRRESHLAAEDENAKQRDETTAASTGAKRQGKEKIEKEGTAKKEQTKH